MAGQRGSPELGLAAALGHGSSPTMAQQRERSTGSPSQASLGRGRRRGDRASTTMKWRRKCSLQVALGRVEKRRRMGIGVVEDDEAGKVLTQAREVVRRPGDDARWLQWRSSVEVALELEEGRRREGTGTVKVRGGSQPFIGTRGMRRHWGLNGRALKTSVTHSEEGGFKAELEDATELRRGRSLGLSMAQEEGGMAARNRGGGDNACFARLEVEEAGWAGWAKKAGWASKASWAESKK
jgi:hypothetical protein